LRRLFRLRAVLATVLVAGLTACASGTASDGFTDPALEAAFLFLPQGEGGVGGAGFVIAPGVAVTNRHNANLIAPEDVLGASELHDILFFRTERQMPVSIGTPRAGAEVIAYGDGGGALREARGPIELLPVTVENCPTCPPGTGFGYRAGAGPGFSGGPVVDRETGTVLGLTFGFINAPLESGKPRLMLAYDMALVQREWAQLPPQ
jgi:hypothetical protein